MATDTEIRAWLKDRGRGAEVTKRGKVKQSLRDEYAAEHGQAPAGDTDYDGSVTEADFGPDALDDYTEPGGQADELADEQTPRQHPSQTSRARRQSAAARARSIWSRATGETPAAGKRPSSSSSSPTSRPRRSPGPWMPTAVVIEHFWSQLAWAARPLPPVQKILAAQAPMAGVMLQDSLKDTFVDRYVLQPAARAEDRLQGLSATLGPGLFTAAIALRGGAAEDPQRPGMPLLDEEGMPVWNGPTQAMVTGLRFSLMSWLKIAEKSADEIKQAADELTSLGNEADELIKWILAPSQGENPKDIEREAKQRGRDFIIREPSSPTSSSSTRTAPAPDKARGVPGAATQAEMTAHLEGMAQSSAMRPAPAGKPD